MYFFCLRSSAVSSSLWGWCLLVLLLFAATAPIAWAIPLTMDNFLDVTDGKTIFIKFYAPWCGHCRAMADDWTRLEEDWKSHPIAFVGDVDCTSDEGRPLCEDFEIATFPTLIYGDPMAAETYDGPRDYESLSAHAQAHIGKPICSAFRTTHCSEQEKATISKLEAKSLEELEAIVIEVTGHVQSAEDEFDQKVNEIQAQYEVYVQEYNKKMEDIKLEYSFDFVEQLVALKTTDENSQDSAMESEEL